MYFHPTPLLPLIEPRRQAIFAPFSYGLEVSINRLPLVVMGTPTKKDGVILRPPLSVRVVRPGASVDISVRPRERQKNDESSDEVGRQNRTRVVRGGPIDWTD